MTPSLLSTCRNLFVSGAIAMLAGCTCGDSLNLGDEDRRQHIEDQAAAVEEKAHSRIDDIAEELDDAEALVSDADEDAGPDGE